MTDKTASATIYLVEELGDARIRCDQLMRYTDEAVKLIEKSSHRDHFFEVAGHLIHAIPEALFKLHKSLQAVALAASRIDYEEIKQELLPEKVNQLEKVLEDVRIRHVKRRSLPVQELGMSKWKVTAVVGEKLSSDDDEKRSRFEEGKPADPTENMSPEDAKKWKEEHKNNKDKFKTAATMSPEIQLELETAALALRKAAKGQRPKQNATSAVRSIAKALVRMGEDRAYDMLWRASDVMQASGTWDLDNETSQASHYATEDEKRSRFEEGKPADPTENMSAEDAKKWKEEHAKNKDKFTKEATLWKVA